MDALGIIALGLAGSGGSGGDVTKQYVDEHLALKADKTETAEFPIASVTSGINPTITDSADGYMQGLEVYGKSRAIKNLFTTEGATEGRYLYYNGNQGQSPDWCITDFIEISGNYITFSVITDRPGNNPSMCFYDDNKEFISGTNYGNHTTLTLTIPNSAKYIRACYEVVDTSWIDTMRLVLAAYPASDGILSIGDSGSLTITTANSDSSESSTATLTTGLPLCGIPVATGETYTDEQGQKWLADEMSVEGVTKRTYKITLDGSETWLVGGETSASGSKRMLCQMSTTHKAPSISGTTVPTMICNSLTPNTVNNIHSGVVEDAIAVSGTSTGIDIYVRVSGISTEAGLQAYFTSNPTTIIYELATPTTTALTAEEQQALLALRTFDNVTNVTITDDPFADMSYLKNTNNGKAAEQLADNLRASLGWISAVPEMHRNILRGKYLGSSVSTAQLAAIEDGSFDDLYVGDYWTIPVTIGGVTKNINWRIADIDYYLNAGDTPLEEHHLVIVPDTGLYAARMNATASNSGGYKASEMYTTNLGTAKTAINTAFPDMVLSHRDLIPGNPADSPTWADSTAELLSEIMVYGTQIFSPCNGSGQYNNFLTIAKSQLALFRLAPWFGVADDTYWLRDVVGDPSFAAVSAEGNADGWGASNEKGVRPYFLLGDAT